MERGLHLKNEGTFHPFFFSPILLHVLNSTTIFDFTRRKKTEADTCLCEARDSIRFENVSKQFEGGVWSWKGNDLKKKKKILFIYLFF